jgi:membrane protein DedA with SNARE-associated domain
VWFATWGFWAVLVAGFSPIPYKVFAFAAGAMSMLLPGFVLASIAGRGGRFFLVAALVARGGPRMQRVLKRYVDRIGWALVAVGAILYVALRFSP